MNSKPAEQPQLIQVAAPQVNASRAGRAIVGSNARVGPLVDSFEPQASGSLAPIAFAAAFWLAALAVMMMLVD